MSCAPETRGRGLATGGLLAAIACVGLTFLTAVVSWRSHLRREHTASAARLTQLSIFRARLYSIYGGINHFVVLDPDAKRVEIYADSGSTEGSFDPDDPRLATESLAAGIDLALPSQDVALGSPLDATASVDRPWALPEPDRQARWGTKLLGLMTTPAGLVQSAEATPQTIEGGLIVFSGNREVAVVGILGQSGSLRSFELVAGRWIEL